MFRLMTMRAPWIATLMLAGLLTTAASAQDSPAVTVVTVDEMCGGCVKQITKHFTGAEGIASVQCDIPSKTVTFTPAEGYNISPRGVWVSLEKIGKVPVKLVGPKGTFTTKPE